MAGAHMHLDNLTVIVDRNRLQQGDRTEHTMQLEPLADKWRAFGRHVVEVDGHDIGALVQTFAQLPLTAGKPTCIIAHTNKGQGVSLMQDHVAWHHKVPNASEYATAIAELSQGATDHDIA